jgi:hypothetical protein
VKFTVIPTPIRGSVRLDQEQSGTNFEEGSDQLETKDRCRVRALRDL